MCRETNVESKPDFQGYEKEIISSAINKFRESVPLVIVTALAESVNLSRRSLDWMVQIVEIIDLLRNETRNSDENKAISELIAFLKKYPFWKNLEDVVIFSEQDSVKAAVEDPKLIVMTFLTWTYAVDSAEISPFLQGLLKQDPAIAISMFDICAELQNKDIGSLVENIKKVESLYYEHRLFPSPMSLSRYAEIIAEIPENADPAILKNLLELDTVRALECWPRDLHNFSFYDFLCVMKQLNMSASDVRTLFFSMNMSDSVADREYRHKIGQVLSGGRGIVAEIFEEIMGAVVSSVSQEYADLDLQLTEAKAKLREATQEEDDAIVAVNIAKAALDEIYKKMKVASANGEALLQEASVAQEEWVEASKKKHIAKKNADAASRTVTDIQILQMQVHAEAVRYANIDKIIEKAISRFVEEMDIDIPSAERLSVGEALRSEVKVVLKKYFKAIDNNPLANHAALYREMMQDVADIINSGMCDIISTRAAQAFVNIQKLWVVQLKILTRVSVSDEERSILEDEKTSCLTEWDTSEKILERNLLSFSVLLQNKGISNETILCYLTETQRISTAYSLKFHALIENMEEAIFPFAPEVFQNAVKEITLALAASKADPVKIEKLLASVDQFHKKCHAVMHDGKVAKEIDAQKSTERKKADDEYSELIERATQLEQYIQHAEGAVEPEILELRESWNKELLEVRVLAEKAYERCNQLAIKEATQFRKEKLNGLGKEFSLEMRQFRGEPIIPLFMRRETIFGSPFKRVSSASPGGIAASPDSTPRPDRSSVDAVRSALNSSAVPVTPGCA